MDDDLPVNPNPQSPAAPINLSPMPESQPITPPIPTPAPTPQPQETPPMKGEPQSGGNNNLFLGLLVILLALALALAGYLFYQNMQLKSQIMKLQTVSSPSPTPTLDPTADWKTYINEKYGFNFKYPDGYKIEERVPGFVVLTLLNENIPQGGISFDARLRDPYDNLSSAKDNIKTSLAVSREDEIDGWQVYQGMGKEGEIKGIEFRQAIIPYKTGVLEAETIATSSYLSIFDQILSTFKFIEASPSPEVSPTASPSASPSISPTPAI